MTIDPKNLEALVKRSQYGVAEFLRRAGIKNSVYYNYLNGVTATPRKETWRAFANGLGMEYEELMEAVRAQPMGGEVKLIGTTSAGVLVDNGDIGDAEGVGVSTSFYGDPDAFALELSGESMAPDFRSGDVCVFAPRAAVHPGDACFVQLDGSADDGEGNTFKLVYDLGDGRVELRPINTRDFNPRIVDGESIIRCVKQVGHITRKDWVPKS